MGGIFSRPDRRTEVVQEVPAYLEKNGIMWAFLCRHPWKRLLNETISLKQ